MGRVKKQGATKINERAQMLEDIEKDLEEARAQDKPSFQAIAGLQRLKAQLLGIDAPPPPKRRQPKRTGDLLADHLATLQSLAMTAYERGSVDAAARLTSQIEKVIERIEIREEQRRAKDLEGMSEEQVAEMLIAEVMELPLPVRRRIAQAIGD